MAELETIDCGFSAFAAKQQAELFIALFQTLWERCRLDLKSRHQQVAGRGGLHTLTRVVVLVKISSRTCTSAEPSWNLNRLSNVYLRRVSTRLRYGNERLRFVHVASGRRTFFRLPAEPHRCSDLIRSFTSPHTELANKHVGYEQAARL